MTSQPPKFLVWNARGLNSPASPNVIRQLVAQANPSIVFLHETKLAIVDVDLVKHCLGNKLEFFFLLAGFGHLWRYPSGLGSVSRHTFEPALHNHHCHSFGYPGWLPGRAWLVVVHGSLRS